MIVQGTFRPNFSELGFMSKSTLRFMAKTMLGCMALMELGCMGTVVVACMVMIASTAISASVDLRILVIHWCTAFSSTSTCEKILGCQLWH